MSMLVSTLVIPVLAVIAVVILLVTIRRRRRDATGANPYLGDTGCAWPDAGDCGGADGGCGGD